MNKSIINGIDVNECEFYNDCECDAYRHEYWEPQDNTKDMCKEHEDCYFKQLKRLQEENEELKKRQITKNGFICDCEQNTKYKQALEEIRKISKQCMTKDLCSIDCNYADHCYIEDAEVPTYDICKLIIEKINEALNDRD